MSTSNYRSQFANERASDTDQMAAAKVSKYIYEPSKGGRNDGWDRIILIAYGPTRNDAYDALTAPLAEALAAGYDLDQGRGHLAPAAARSRKDTDTMSNVNQRALDDLAADLGRDVDPTELAFLGDELDAGASSDHSDLLAELGFATGDELDGFAIIDPAELDEPDADSPSDEDLAAHGL